MTPHWFIYKGLNSQDMGVQVVAYPPIVRPERRLKMVTVPGRSGTLTISEGDFVYNAYTRKMTVAFRISQDPERVLEWLSGSGILVCGNEPDFGYVTTMMAPFSASRLQRDIYQGELQLYTQPFKQLYPEPTIQTQEASYTLRNGGAVPSLPWLSTSGLANRYVALGGTIITVANDRTVIIDSEAETILYEDGTDASASVGMTNGFPIIPKGVSTLSQGSGASTAVLMPRWRWI